MPAFLALLNQKIAGEARGCRFEEEKDGRSHLRSLAARRSIRRGRLGVNYQMLRIGFHRVELEVRETTSLTATRSLVPYPRPINQSVSGIRALFALPLGRKASLATFELEASSHPLRCPSNIHRSADVSVPPHFLVYLGVSNIGQT